MLHLSFGQTLAWETKASRKRELDLEGVLVGTTRGWWRTGLEYRASRRPPGECEPWIGLIDRLSTMKSKVALEQQRP